VLVATIRSLKMQGGLDKKSLTKEDLAALERGLPHLAHHVKNVQQFGLPVVVALNRILSDTDAELQMVQDYAAKLGVKVVLTEVWAKGGEGGEALAREVLSLLDGKTAKYAPIYSVDLPIKEKIETVVKKVYGGDGVDYTPSAERQIEYLTSIGLGNTPVCIAKTQYSLTDDATRLCTPKGFRITINEVWGSAGAGFVVAKAGDIMTMPGLPKVPAAEGMSVNADGDIVGLS
jgi:formate--tetrahydrofolate ligase